MRVNGLVVDDRGCAYIYAHLRSELATARAEDRRFPPDIFELFEELIAGAKRHAAASVDGAELDRNMRNTAEARGPIMADEMTTTQVAKRLRCSERNVRALCARGTLIARRAGGRLWVEVVSVVEYEQRRKAA